MVTLVTLFNRAKVHFFVGSPPRIFHLHRMVVAILLTRKINSFYYMCVCQSREVLCKSMRPASFESVETTLKRDPTQKIRMYNNG